MESYKSFVIGDHKFCFDEEEERTSQLSYETESDVATSSSDDEYRNINEDDDECSRNISNLTRKRSKRTRKLESLKKVKTSYKTELEIETHYSSASDTTTTEEDLAFCLMMLSRDKWNKKKKKNKTSQEVEEESEGYNKSYECDTCGKVFESYQALGGHRASHKKIKTETEHDNVVVVAEKRIHECPICFRVFQSGQALGGHKRSHGIRNFSVYHRIESVKQRIIDLNLPAPIE